MMSIIKSKSDKRVYKYIKLPNKLSCLLISDKDADKSAAALDVKVGCSLDPRPLYGTAHFLEHMLFMGTEKYPSESEYSEFIKNNGGMNNAYTSLTNTNYHFDCSNEAFDEALDRFSQFFISPTFKQDSTEREMKAVDSEFNQSLQSDAWKFFSLLAINSHENTALNRFNCGSLQTLQQEGIRDALLGFHKQWYSSNIMKLVLTGKHDIEQMEKWAHERFSSIVNKDVVIPELGDPAPYDDKNLGQLFKFLPIKDKDIISFYWFLPYTQEEYETQPMKYHSHLFGHEGENSLLSYLISEGLAQELSAYHDHELWSFSNLAVDITLTRKGLQEYERVIEAVFQYAKIVKERGVQEYIFNENKVLGEIEFDFADKKGAMGYSTHMASKLQLFDDQTIKDVIKHMYIVEKLDKSRIQELSDMLTDPKKVNIYVRSKSFESQLTKEDPWYKTKYEKEFFNEQLLQKIRNPKVVIDKKKLDLPPHNNLLPKNLDVLSKEPELSQRPVLLQQWNDTDLWYKKDDKFERPKAIVNLKIYTNDCMFGRTPNGRVFAEVWNNFLQEYLREFYYMAEMASLHAQSVLYHDNYSFKWSGFNDSLPVFVEETIKRMKLMKIQDHKEIFDQVKEKLMQDWFNFYYDQTYKQAFVTVDNVLINAAHEKKALRKILSEFNFEDFVRQSEDWLKTARFVWFVNGNFDKTSAVKMVEQARQVFNVKPVEKEDLVDVRCIALKQGTNYLLEMPLEDKENENSCLVTYFELGLEGYDLKTKMINEVVMQYLDEPTFNQLRTIEQLGYVVFSRACSNRDIMGTQFLIQSPKQSCEYIVNSLNDFLKDTRQKVKELTEEEFKIHVDAVLVKVSEKDYNLQKDNFRFWQEISTHKYLFDRQEKEIEALKSLKKEDFIGHFEKIYFSEQTKRFDIELTSIAHTDQQAEWKNTNKDKHFKDVERLEVKESLSAFKKKMPLHPDLFKANFATYKL